MHSSPIYRYFKGFDLLDRVFHLTTLSVRPYRKLALKEITGYAKQASRAIHGQIVEERKQKEKRGFTHFLSLPLAQVPEVKEAYKRWREEVLAGAHDGIPPRLLINPDLLHATLLMMDLGDAGMLEKAREALRKVEPRVKELIRERGVAGKLKVQFDQLDIFGTQEECRVVYMRFKEEGE